MGDTSKSGRRRFITTLGAGGAVAAAAVLTQQSGKPPAVPVAAGTTGQGYHVTEHIRNYYRTTQV